jgi:hypothetical protein
MKQCSSCGKVYTDRHPVCPGCQSPVWTPPKRTREDQRTTSVLCRFCGSVVEGGFARCPLCDKMLAPVPLIMFCWLLLLSGPIIIANSVVDIFLTGAVNPWNLPDLLFALAVVPVAWGVIHANERALFFLRILLVFSLVAILGLALVANLRGDFARLSELAGLLLSRFAGGVPMWFYFNSRDVKEFCGIETY